MRHRKTACFEALVWNLILLNLAAASCSLCGRLQTFETSWVSVQAVVLNTLKDRPRNQVNYSQSSATFTTHKHRNVLLMSLWFLLVCHALTQKMMRSRQFDMFLSTSQKRSKTHVVTKSLYIKTWFVCLK